MADLKISQLNSLAGTSLANNDVVAVVDTSASETKKITSKELVQYGYGLVDASTLDGDIIEPGTTSARGTIQLTDSTGSTSTTTAATPNAVKSAYDLANAALPKTGGTMTGQILGDNSTSASTPGYAFDGDPNTGLYTTGADELALTTGGSARLTIDSTGTVVIPGNFTVQGTTTTIDTTTLVVEDKNIEMGAVATPSDVTADGGGITLRGTTDKTINWVDATDAWTSSERFSVPTGTAAAPTLTFTGDPNTGIYSPGADQLALSTNGTGRLFVDSSGRVKIGSGGTQGALSVQAATDGNLHVRDIKAVNNSLTGVFFDVLNDAQSAVQDLALRGATTLFYNASGETARITSAGRLGVGTSSPSQSLTTVGNIKIAGAQASNNAKLCLTRTDTSWSINNETDLRFYWGSGDTDSPGSMAVVFTNGGKVGIGTTPDSQLHVQALGSASGYTSANNAGIKVDFGLSNNGVINLVGGGDLGVYRSNNSAAYDIGIGFGNNSNRILQFITAGSERARIDSSGRLLVGTSSSVWDGQVEVARVGGSQFVGHRYGANAFPAELNFLKSRGASVGTNTIVVNGDSLANINFLGADGSSYVAAAQISGVIDGTPGANDMPGRLVFSTTADGASSPTERLRITSAGRTQVTGAYDGNITAVAALDIDCSAGNYFTKTINGNSTFTVSNVPASRVYSFTLELTHTSGTITWFSGVVWSGGTAPTLTTGKVHLFMFVTDDGGTTWRAAVLKDYNS